MKFIRYSINIFVCISITVLLYEAVLASLNLADANAGIPTNSASYKIAEPIMKEFVKTQKYYIKQHIFFLSMASSKYLILLWLFNNVYNRLRKLSLNYSNNILNEHSLKKLSFSDKNADE